MTRRRGLACGHLVALLCLAATASAAHASAGAVHRFTYGSGAGAYPYIVYVPSTYRVARRAPLVVATHGCQTSADQFMRATRYNRVAERAGFVVLYPDVTAAEVAQPGPLSRCWQIFAPSTAHRGSPDERAIAGMAHAVMRRWRIDGQRVYMAGMSAGGFETSIMAAAYPDLFAAVAIAAGGAYADGGCILGGRGLPVAGRARLARAEMGRRARIVPRMVLGGDADTAIIPACADKALAQGLRTDNLVVGTRQTGPISLRRASVRHVAKRGGYGSTVSTYLDPSGCVIGERWLIAGMEHFWPGGATDPALHDFTDPKGPNGAEITWAFLRRYTKRSTALPCAEARPVCRARWETVRVPVGAHDITATVGGRRVRTRVRGRRVRVRLPATRRAATTVVLAGRTAGGARFTRRRSFAGCR